MRRALILGFLCLYVTESAHARELPQRGAMTCDLLLDMVTFAPATAAPTIERDRMQMFGSPEAAGGSVKYLPFGDCDEASMTCWSGGRYLFDTPEQAADYRDMLDAYNYGGTLFLDRPEFLDAECFAWDTVGAATFATYDEFRAIRTVRWQVPAEDDLAVDLRVLWPRVRRAAQHGGAEAVWLLYSQDRAHVAVVLLADDASVLAGLTPAISFGTPEYDRTLSVLTIWRPFVPGDQGEPSAWPNSPPLPEPACGDGVCEPSRGEDGVSCAVECAPGCGDGICDADESNTSCPSDCFWF